MRTAIYFNGHAAPSDERICKCGAVPTDTDTITGDNMWPDRDCTAEPIGLTPVDPAHAEPEAPAQPDADPLGLGIE